MTRGTTKLNLVQILANHGESVPRYTSYPTAPHFRDGLGPQVLTEMLASLEAATPVSVYMHIPFSDRLCWFCGCHTKQTLRHEPVVNYVRHLVAEIALLKAKAGRKLTLGALHLGGGSPSLLKTAEFTALRMALEDAFDILPDAEIAIEIDPSDSGALFLEGVKILGVTRASIGVQDFNHDVQVAINRIQTFEETRDLALALREAGVGSVNIDVLYGLPLQTSATIASTTEQVLQLAPDRIALFGYAHVPWMKKHQTLIRTEDLPGTLERFNQAELAALIIDEAGLSTIGIDHFARPGDPLAIAAAKGHLRRNFQGYTTDDCAALIGLGASSIHSYGGGFVQNIIATGVYETTVASGVLPSARGFRRSQDDRMRGAVIERLMCDFSFSFEAMNKLFGASFDAIRREALLLAQTDNEGLCTVEGDRFLIPQEARPFTRIVASKFDAWLKHGNVRYSKAV